MSYLKRRMTRDELRAMWNRLSMRLNERQLVDRFGPSPRWFLDENVGGNDAPTYAQFHPLLVDQKGREYVPRGESDRQLAYIRLPKSITARQNTMEGLLSTRLDERMDYPRVGETLLLRAIGVQEDNLDYQWSRVVTNVAASSPDDTRIATGRIAFDRPLPLRDQIETPVQRTARDNQMQRAIQHSEAPLPVAHATLPRNSVLASRNATMTSSAAQKRSASPRRAASKRPLY